MSDYMVPPIDAVTYGRKVLQAECEKLRRFERQATDKGDTDAAERWRRLYRWIEWQLIGEGEGCVITAFDARWLDESFRDVTSKALAP